MRFLTSLPSIILSLLLAIGPLPLVPVPAVTVAFRWSGDSGYTARGSFRYDEKTAPAVIREEGAGRTRAIESLTVSFLDRRGREIATYDNVSDGISRADYFRFNFNPRTGHVFGPVDLGGDSAGETYLKGTVNANLALFHVGEEDVAIDEDNSPTILTQFLR